MSVRIYCDFDGTITSQDTIVYLTERFGGGPEMRHELLGQLRDGHLTLDEVIRRELRSVRVGWPEALAALDRDVKVDPTFGPFVAWCRSNGFPLVILSSGMEPVVRHFLPDPDLPVIAHGVRVEPDGWHYEPVPEHDKVRILETANSPGPLVYIGDGASDVCVIPKVDRLFAKHGRYLERYCRQRGLACIAFRDFEEIRRELAAGLPLNTETSACPTRS